ncbi:MAG: VOC family protein [Bacillaceae bacterium]|nr:VOC family protein [Bacillaceae bacterium]
MVRLYRVILPVTDIEKATEYYSYIFNVSGKRVSPGRHYFDCDGTVLACFDPKADGDHFTLNANPDYIYFSVSELEKIYDRVKTTGCTIDEGIETQPWGERCFYAKDPFGNPLCFVDESTVFIGQEQE